MNTTKFKLSALTMTGFTILALTSGCQPSSQNLAGTPVNGSGTNNTYCSATGCYSTSGGGAVPTATPINTDPVASPVPLTSGSNGQFTASYDGILNTYVGRNMGKISDVQVNVQLHPTSDSLRVFLGSVTIRFNERLPDNSIMAHNGVFTNGSTSTHGNNIHILTADSNGVPVYRIMLEDRLGAIELLLYPTGSGGGGDTGGTIAGKIYYRDFALANGGQPLAPNPLFEDQFTQSAGNWCNIYDPYCYYDDRTGIYYDHFPPNPYAFCWAGSPNGAVVGPYDCRNTSVPPTQGDKPFTLLGTVQNLTINSALGI